MESLCKKCIQNWMGNKCNKASPPNERCVYFKNYKDYIKPEIEIGDKCYVIILDKYCEEATVTDVFIDYFGVHIVFVLEDGACGSFMPTDIGKSVFVHLEDALESRKPKD